MKFFGLGATFLAALSMATTACDKLQTPLPEMRPAQNTQPPVNAQEENQKKLSQSLQQQLDQMRMELDALKAKVKEISQQERARAEKDIERLEADFQAAQQKLSELKAATADRWKELKDLLLQAVEKLRSDINATGKSLG